MNVSFYGVALLVTYQKHGCFMPATHETPAETPDIEINGIFSDKDCNNNLLPLFEESEIAEMEEIIYNKIYH